MLPSCVQQKLSGAYVDIVSMSKECNGYSRHPAGIHQLMMLQLRYCRFTVIIIIVLVIIVIILSCHKVISLEEGHVCCYKPLLLQ